MYEIEKKSVQAALDEKLANFPPDVLKEFVEVRRKAEAAKPQPEDIRALREFIERIPDLWHALSDLAHVARRSLIDGSFPLATQFSIEFEIDELKREYDYDRVPRLERMLIDQIIINWLQVQKAQLNYEMVIRPEFSSPSDDIGWGHLVNLAHARYLRALESLARVRRLRNAEEPVQAPLALDAVPSTPRKSTPEEKKVKTLHQ